jgi:hypothetical protein
MSARNVIQFLRVVATRPDVLQDLRTKTKDTVLRAAAEDFRLPFSGQDFDSVVWALEVYLAKKRADDFDARFGLWQTMWGQYYLEYLVADLMASFQEADIEAVIAGQPA